MIRVDFLDYLTKGEIIFGDRIGFDTGTEFKNPRGIRKSCSIVNQEAV